MLKSWSAQITMNIVSNLLAQLVDHLCQSVAIKAVGASKRDSVHDCKALGSMLLGRLHSCQPTMQCSLIHNKTLALYNPVWNCEPFGSHIFMQFPSSTFMVQCCSLDSQNHCLHNFGALLQLLSLQSTLHSLSFAIFTTWLAMKNARINFLHQLTLETGLCFLTGSGHYIWTCAV